MKKALSLLVIALACVSAQAQLTYPTQTLINTASDGLTVTNNATLSPTNYIFTVRSADFIGVQCTYQLNGAGTNSPTVKFAKSVDGTTFETTPSITLGAVLLNGTTAVHTFDKVDVTGVGALKLVSVQNGVSDQAITNLVIKVGFKND